jgi:hypothetical protein
VSPKIPTAIVSSVAAKPLSPRAVRAAFARLLDAGADLRAAGTANKRPQRLLDAGYVPRHELELLGTRFFLSDVMQNPELRYFVAYLAQATGGAGRLRVHARILYKDVSLIWRCASHLIDRDGEFWIGKGDVRTGCDELGELVYSVESTTDLPLEMQTALESISRETRRVRYDRAALGMVLRNAPAGRIEPYRDFVEPRRRAASDRRNLINGGRSIAWFERANDPTSLVIKSGYEPDFTAGLVEVAHTHSAMYGGTLRRFRILSTNKRIQYLFFGGPHQAWIIPAQATTTELSSYGVRTVDVIADEDLFVPGYEYHYVDDSVDPPELYSQIPAGFAGEPSDHDDSRADASAWLDRLPVIEEFRRRLLR